MPWRVETTEQRAKAPRSCNEDTWHIDKQNDSRDIVSILWYAVRLHAWSRRLIVRQIQEKYNAKGKLLYFSFVDLEKAFDRVLRKVLWWLMLCTITLRARYKSMAVTAIALVSKLGYIKVLYWARCCSYLCLKPYPCNFAPVVHGKYYLCWWSCNYCRQLRKVKLTTWKHNLYWEKNFLM